MLFVSQLPLSSAEKLFMISELTYAKLVRTIFLSVFEIMSVYKIKVQSHGN